MCRAREKDQDVSEKERKRERVFYYPLSGTHVIFFTE